MMAPPTLRDPRHYWPVKDGERMGAVALIDKPNVPYAWWRIVTPFRRLRQYGIPVRTDWDSVDAPTIYEHEIVILPRITGLKVDRATVERWANELLEQATLAVYETDDDIFSESFADHVRLSDWMLDYTEAELEQERELSRWIMAQCDGVTVASQALSDTLRPFTDKPIVTVPNAIDTRLFRSQLAAKTQWADYLTIGWAGTRRPDRDLEPMAEAWGRIGKRYPQVRFLIGGYTPGPVYRHLEPEQIIRLEWTTPDNYPMSYQVDIGCCSVADTPYSRAKTPIKAWEYALAGAAVVASPCLYSDDVIHNETGYLAETADQWEAAITALIEDHSLRKHLSWQLRTDVEQKHALDTELWRWAFAYKLIADYKRV